MNGLTGKNGQNQTSTPLLNFSQQIYTDLKNDENRIKIVEIRGSMENFHPWYGLASTIVGLASIPMD